VRDEALVEAEDLAGQREWEGNLEETEAESVELTLTDQNFDEEIQKAEKPVLVDFWTVWCGPCTMLTPILEKLAREYEDKVVLAKVNLDLAPLIAQKFGIDRIPTVILFREGKPISGFIGVRPEQAIREWLEKILGEGKKVGEKEEEGEVREEKAENKEEKEIEEIIQWYEDYAKKNGFRLNPDRATVVRLVKGLLANEKKYGSRYCPCRRVTGNIEDDRPKICPCKWHREEIEKDGHCYCGLFAR